MCGITGFWNRSARSGHDTVGWGRAMNARLHHRGPDDNGLWQDPAGGMVLATCRLAIIDLSPAGHQPMTSHCGRYVIAYNGEIYNFHDIRRELEAKGVRFTGNSDTEVLLEGCASWGV